MHAKEAANRRADTLASAIEINQPVNRPKARRAMERCGGLVREATDQEMLDAKAKIGAGGLGSPVLLALAAAGVGSITVIDDDIVELTNLQRQLAHRVEDIGRPKTASAERAILALSPGADVVTAAERLDSENAERLFAGADIVVDTSDSFATRRDVAAATEALK